MCLNDWGMSFPIGIHFLLVVQNVTAYLTINGILYLMNCDIRKWEIKFHGLSNYKVLLSSISYQYTAKYACMETKNLDLTAVYQIAICLHIIFKTRQAILKHVTTLSF